MAFRPYLNFGGNCREAMTRYQEIFGGQLDIMGVGDMPADEPAPPEMANLVIHAALTFGDDMLMGSDTYESEFGPVTGMYVYYDRADLSIEDANKVFAALADGGTIEMPIGPTFWSPAFGVCVDRFGTPWMVSAGMAPS